MSIKEFASKYLVLFNNPEVATRNLEDVFGNACSQLGFIMDCGETFVEKYQNEHALYSIVDLREIVNSIDDAMVLGSAMYSRWRYITHWAQEDLLSPKNREWFIVALTRLEQIS